MILAPLYADMKPTMAQLMNLETSEGDNLQIIDSLAADWKRTGLLMDLDPMGRKVASIEAEHAHKRNGPVVCCQEIFVLWLDRTDATWESLIDLLIDSEQRELAERVKCTLGL